MTVFKEGPLIVYQGEVTVIVDKHILWGHTHTHTHAQSTDCTLTYWLHTRQAQTLMSGSCSALRLSHVEFELCLQALVPWTALWCAA